MKVDHLYKLSQVPPTEKTEGGMRVKASKKNFPILCGMSLYKLILNPNGIREPHWHANAEEMGYCLKGEVLINLFDTYDQQSTFLVRMGDVFSIPSGALHHIENVGKTTAELVLAFSHEEPEEFSISESLGAFSDSVLGNTWHIQDQILHSLKRSLKPTFASLRQGAAVIPDAARYESRYRFPVEAKQPLLINEAGSARMARQDVWPMAQHMAMYSLRINGKGMREPHWHPETAEMGYVKEGRGRMTILSPGGNMDTYIMEEGDMYFIPKAYPHHIENMDSGKELHITIFFNQGMPRDIGFSASLLSYSNDVLASATNTDPDFFKQLNKYYENLFIVEKINPLDT